MVEGNSQNVGLNSAISPCPTPFTQSKVLSTYPTKNIVCTKEGDERKMKAQKGHIILKLQEFKGSSSLLVQHITNWNENGR